MIIEQTRPQMHDAIAFHTGASISRIRLAQSRVWSLPGVDVEEFGKVAFDIKFEASAFHRHEDFVTIDTDFRFAVISESRDPKPFIIIECKFEAQYGLAAGYTPSEEEIEAFRAANAVFNCWPFFREYVQSSATRMNCPPPPVPFLRIVRKEEPELAMQQLNEPSTNTDIVRKSKKRKRSVRRGSQPPR